MCNYVSILYSFETVVKYNILPRDNCDRYLLIMLLISARASDSVALQSEFRGQKRLHVGVLDLVQYQFGHELAAVAAV